MKHYCPDCDQNSAFMYWNKRKQKLWLACTICWKKDLPKKFHLAKLRADKKIPYIKNRHKILYLVSDLHEYLERNIKR